MEVAHIDAFQRDPKRFWSFYAQRFDALAHKQPNAAHRALAAMEAAGLLQAVITQNVDELHHKAGTRELVEVHGSIAGCVCLSCGARVTRERARERMVADPDGVPRCEGCEQPLKPQVVLFGELLPEEALLRARQLCERADVLLCIGSSLEVYPVAALPELTLAGGGAVAIITKGSTPFDGVARVRLEGDVVAEMDALLAALGVAA
jgi:NAD-dependent deacetylase